MVEARIDLQLRALTTIFDESSAEAPIDKIWSSSP